MSSQSVNVNKTRTIKNITKQIIAGINEAKLFETPGGTCSGILICRFFFESQQNKAEAPKEANIATNIPFAPSCSVVSAVIALATIFPVCSPSASTAITSPLHQGAKTINAQTQTAAP